MKMKVACAALLMGLLVSPAMANIVAGFDPVVSTPAINEIFDVNIVADIPQAEGLAGWGLDLAFDGGVADLLGVTINLPWVPVYAPDGDELAGIGYLECVWGEDVVLATLTFQYLGGTTPLDLSYTPTDLTEGFALCGGGFAAGDFVRGWITPEPATLSLLVLGGLALIRRR